MKLSWVTPGFESRPVHFILHGTFDYTRAFLSQGSSRVMAPTRGSGQDGFDISQAGSGPVSGRVG